MHALPPVTVILLNYRSAEDLPACLGALLAQTFQNFDVLLVDQGMKDGSTQHMLEVFGPAFGGRLQALFAGRNLGFAGGCNLAFPQAKGTWWALLNTDAVPAPGWLEALVKVGESEERVTMCASRIHLLEHPARLENIGQGLYPDGLNVPIGRGALDGPAWDTPREVLCPSAAAGLYRADAVRSVGGLDSRFFAYGEDLDLGLSLRAKGGRCLYVPDARVSHHLSGTWGRRSLRKTFLVERNRLWVALHHFPLAALAALPALTALRWGATLREGFSGKGPLAHLGSALRPMPKPGPPPPLGTRLGAATRLLLTAGAATSGVAAALLTAPAHLRTRRELRELGAQGSKQYPFLIDAFGASMGEAAKQWLGDPKSPPSETPSLSE